ncbi:MAG: tryptophan-rich sensory protein [Trichodesmium sp. St16_bin4-tuft]|nr:tryptophan-rich sensory protein [Trichodesmium sp. MAG_R01]MDE5073419.1 tryptophan-rich sensory protein [Trichodesmium sp. St5_bin8]MDE5099866.1 tryptophan-rich sensory protein [Trichodesmium sp. St16_bin4-tuft]MDE5104444.1 tryptophan-rich sensory protein [Trichodesmium sp. St19_bin2]
MIKSWVIIGSVTFLIPFSSNFFIRSSDVQWFRRLQRPSWLTFERLIPLIWTTIFICGAWSAYIIWEQEPGTQKTWLLMALYLLLEIVTIAYTPVMFRTQNLQVGTIIGGTGFVLSIILILSIWQINSWAIILLLPYIFWSPIGTYTTWEMSNINSES